MKQPMAKKAEKTQALILSKVSKAAKRQFSFQAVVALLERRCAQGQVALLIDDLQWADAGTLLVVHRLCQAIQQLPLLVVVTRRPVPCGGIRQLADAPWTAPRHRCETGLTPATLNGGCPKVYGSCLPVLPPRSAW